MKRKGDLKMQQAQEGQEQVTEGNEVHEEADQTQTMPEKSTREEAFEKIQSMGNQSSDVQLVHQLLLDIGIS
jgi:hypothetical protein